MRIIDYTPAHFETLLPIVQRMGSRNLSHREFVNHYYDSNDWCRLHILFSTSGAVIGTIGVERMPFRYESADLTVGFGTNYYSLEPGAGGFLYLHWMKACPMAISLGASPDAHRILHSQRWPYFESVKMLCLNKPYTAYESDSAWKRSAKWLARQTMRRPLHGWANLVPDAIVKRVSVHEETRYSDDLLPGRSPFAFRFAPNVEYLNWRYSLGLPFVRYRVFRVISDGHSSGYVILNETSERLLVSQCDGEDAELLAWGVILSFLKAAEEDRQPRTVRLTCCHPKMAAVYRSLGFKMDGLYPLALGPQRRTAGPPSQSDTSNWLINYDWGDNGLVDLTAAA